MSRTFRNHPIGRDYRKPWNIKHAPSGKFLWGYDKQDDDHGLYSPKWQRKLKRAASKIIRQRFRFVLSLFKRGKLTLE